MTLVASVQQFADALGERNVILDGAAALQGAFAQDQRSGDGLARRLALRQ